MEIRKGTAVSRGVVIGPAFVLEAEGARIPRKFVMPEETPREVERFEKALAGVVDDVHRDVVELASQFNAGYDVADIFRMHLRILDDPKLKERTTRLIRSRNFTAEYAVAHVMRQYARPFEESNDAYMAQRKNDFYDMEHRLLNRLLGERREDLAHLSEPVILVAPDLTPSQTVALNRSKILAFVTDGGGRASHTAILAGALGIPAVVGLGKLSADVSGGDTLIVDGTHGIVITAPDEATCERYEARQRTVRDMATRLDEEVRDLPAVTLDGRAIELMANIEFPHEVQDALKHGASGIGLYRTEFLFHTRRPVAPDENAHYAAYIEALRHLGERPLVVRLLDLGADKFPTGPPERNPFLGCRSIRLLLRNMDMFRTQLRAVLRASGYGHVKFMFPLIANLDEIRQAKEVVADVMAELDREGIAYNKDIEIGIMIEVPSAAIVADRLAKEVDFFSLGTNDLIQYTLAVDRDNAEVARLFSPTDPAVLRLMQMTIDAANRNDISVSICGEMAADLRLTILLVGMGLREISTSSATIPELKKVIRSITYADAQRVAEHTCSLDNAGEAMAFLEEKAKEVLAPEDL